MRNFWSVTPLVLALAAVILAVFQFVQVYNSAEWDNPSDEMVTKWENRVQAMREAIPPNVNHAGYVDGSMLGNASVVFDVNEFQLMQYSMAPVVLKMGIEESWIIGNFDAQTDFKPWLDAQIGNYDIQNFGFGLYLIHRLGD